MPDNYFDEPVAATYDATCAEEFTPDEIAATVGFLAGHARGGRALELGIGTGRIALPLAASGVPVHGVDLSPAMVARLREKPGGADLPVTVGDFARASLKGRFELVYLVFNTITNLTSQDDQVACFENAATHLAPGGRFVVEVFVPILQRLPPGETTRIFHRTEGALSYDEYDVVTQQMYSHHYAFTGDRYERVSIPFRYVWPAELDLMARIAGLRLTERWGDWSRAPFTSGSASHISVWEKSAS